MTPPTATLHAWDSAACSVIVEAYGPGMRVTYNKLIRDRIPEVIQANGRHAVTQADGYAALHARQVRTRCLRLATTQARPCSLRLRGPPDPYRRSRAVVSAPPTLALALALAPSGAAAAAAASAACTALILTAKSSSFFWISWTGAMGSATAAYVPSLRSSGRYCAWSDSFCTTLSLSLSAATTLPITPRAAVTAPTTMATVPVEPATRVVPATAEAAAVAAEPTRIVHLDRTPDS